MSLSERVTRWQEHEVQEPEDRGWDWTINLKTFPQQLPFEGSTNSPNSKTALRTSSQTHEPVAHILHPNHDYSSFLPLRLAFSVDLIVHFLLFNLSNLLLDYNIQSFFQV